MYLGVACTLRGLMIKLLEAEKLNKGMNRQDANDIKNFTSVKGVSYQLNPPSEKQVKKKENIKKNQETQKQEVRDALQSEIMSFTFKPKAATEKGNPFRSAPSMTQQDYISPQPRQQVFVDDQVQFPSFSKPSQFAPNPFATPNEVQQEGDQEGQQYTSLMDNF